MKFFTLAALAPVALAGVISSRDNSGTSAASKPFKLGVTWGSRTLYLTNSATASEKAADGIVCQLDAGKISCGDQKQGLDYGDLHSFSPLQPTSSPSNNKNWVLNTDGSLEWKTAFGKDVHFSLLGSPTSDKLYAEICSTYGHPDGPEFIPGKAKAYFV